MINIKVQLRTRPLLLGTLYSIAGSIVLVAAIQAKILLNAEGVILIAHAAYQNQLQILQ